jgi:hypothetical protein
MSAAEIAQLHLDQALAEAMGAGYDTDATARNTLGSIIQRSLEYRSVRDVQSKRHLVAENCDPDTDYMFMRP